jgi:3-methyladenine DNA glycosylase AlkD
MTHRLVREVRAALKTAADPAKAPQMQAYMKSAMPYRGVSSPVLRRLCRELFEALPLGSPDEWQAVALDLWRNARYREERYAAILLTESRRYKAWLTAGPAARVPPYGVLPMIEEMIVTGAWWDLVDPLATHHLGDVLRSNPARMSGVMRRWAVSNDMWKRRAAILCQIRFKGDTDLQLLYDCIEPNLAHKDFFIRKAIGWALRQYAWTDPKEIKRYVKANRSRLSPLSIREALKNLAGPKDRPYVVVEPKSSSRTRARSRSI